MNWLKSISDKLITIPADNEPERWGANIKSVRRINPEEKDAMQTIQNERLPFDWVSK